MTKCGFNEGADRIALVLRPTWKTLHKRFISPHPVEVVLKQMSDERVVSVRFAANSGRPAVDEMRSDLESIALIDDRASETFAESYGGGMPYSMAGSCHMSKAMGLIPPEL